MVVLLGGSVVVVMLVVEDAEEELEVVLEAGELEEVELDCEEETVVVVPALPPMEISEQP